MLPVYVVSLARDTERRKVIKEKLDSLQIPFEFIDAVYGKDLSSSVFAQLNPKGKSPETGAYPTPSEVGCTLSHLKVYALVQQRKQQWACIFEDDAIIDDRMKDFYINFTNNLMRFDRDNLYLMGGQNAVSANILVSKSFFTFFYVGKQKFSKLINSEQYVCRTCCYIISNSVTKKMIDLSKTTFLLADDWEFLARNKIINDIYLSDFIDHPVDLSLSHIERERRDVQAVVREKLGKRSVFRRLFNGIFFYTKFCSRLFLTQLYRFKC